MPSVASPIVVSPALSIATLARREPTSRGSNEAHSIPPSPLPESNQQMMPAADLKEVPFIFSQPSADVILRTSDQLEFRLHTQILCQASPVFETLLSTSSSRLTSSWSDTAGREILDVAESGKVLDALMRICYPIVSPKSRPFSDVEPTLRAALKYEMSQAISVLSDDLLAYAPQYPLKVWAIACRTGLEDVARRAAELMLSSTTLDIPGLQDDIDGIAAGHVFRLHEFHRLRGKVESSFKLLSPPTDLAPQTEPENSERLPTFSGFTNPKPDVVVCASDGGTFAVHGSVLALASPSLGRKVEDAVRAFATDAPVETSSSDAALPKVDVDVPGVPLSAALMLCYPGDVGSTGDQDPYDVVTLLLALDKLGIDGVRRSVLDRWGPVAQNNPLRAFLLATGAGLKDCALTAAKYALETELEGVYVCEMESAPPVPYHRLPMHHRSCREIAKTMLSDAWQDSDVERTGDWQERPDYPRSPLYGGRRTSVDHFERGPERSVGHRSYRTPSPGIPQRRVVEDAYRHDRDWRHHQSYYDEDDSSTSKRWLEVHVKAATEKLEKQPGKLAATVADIVEAACEANQWCYSCRIFARDICRVGTALRELPTKVKEVEFEL